MGVLRDLSLEHVRTSCFKPVQTFSLPIAQKSVVFHLLKMIKFVAKTLRIIP